MDSYIPVFLNHFDLATDFKLVFETPKYDENFCELEIITYFNICYKWPNIYLKNKNNKTFLCLSIGSYEYVIWGAFLIRVLFNFFFQFHNKLLAGVEEL